MTRLLTGPKAACIESIQDNVFPFEKTAVVPVSQNFQPQTFRLTAILVTAVFSALVLMGCGTSQKEDAFAKAIDQVKAGDTALAKKNLQEAIDRRPDYHEAYNQLGLLAFAEQDYEKAAEYFKQAVRYNPIATVYRRNLALALVHSGKTQEAQETLSEAIRLDPDQPLLHLDQAKLYRIQGDDRKALDELNIVEQLSPSIREVDTLRQAWSKSSQ